MSQYKHETNAVKATPVAPEANSLVLQRNAFREMTRYLHRVMQDELRQFLDGRKKTLDDVRRAEACHDTMEMLAKMAGKGVRMERRGRA